MRKRLAGKLIVPMALAGLVVVLAQPIAAQRAPLQAPQAFSPLTWSEAAPQGFGDRANSTAWSMAWFQGKVYVGTVRTWWCWSRAYFAKVFGFPYPPDDPDTDCAPDPRNLPLQAEIWQYTPETDTWVRVYQSPNDVELPSDPGWYTARDVGYRGMGVFTEPDGTEALYVGGATTSLLWPPLPPPRLLRSTDGITFEPVPQDPGTVLGDLAKDQTTFRGIQSYKGRFYIINGKIHGEGNVLEAADPAGGNDNFRWVTPQGMMVYEMQVYNGWLYLGLWDRDNGYAVVKTDASGALPYTFIPVVTDGAYREGKKSPTVVSMSVYGDRLYVGTDRPCEVIRINPDDSWDLIVGSPRNTPDGYKYPLSGLDTGFGWPLTKHVWRMQDHEDSLYIGTLDQASRWKNNPDIVALIGDKMGFDLYQTDDGQYFSAITVNGFGDLFQNGARSFASTPYGLFLGGNSFWYGARVYVGTSQPLDAAGFPLAPDRLEVESSKEAVVLSWERASGGTKATRFHVFRAEFAPNSEIGVSDLEAGEGLPGPEVQIAVSALDADEWLPGPAVEIGVTDRLLYVDGDAQPGRPYQYYVVAEDETGTQSSPSNLVRAPSLAPPATFGRLKQTVRDWLARSEIDSGSAVSITAALDRARVSASGGNLPQAALRLERLRQNVLNNRITGLPTWRADDLEILLAKLARRILLAQAQLVAPSDLN